MRLKNVTIRFLNLVLRTVPVSVWFPLSSIGNTVVPHEADHHQCHTLHQWS